MALTDHLEKLRHFQKATEHKSINECAKTTGMSQAGLSKSISNLEKELDVSLFMRSNSGLVLTKEGQLVLELTRNIFLRSHELEAKLRALKVSLVPDRFRIGMYDSIAVYFFPELMSYMNAIYKKVSLTLVVDSSQRLADYMERGSIDLTIGANLQDRFVVKNDFFPLFEDNYSFYVSTHLKNHQEDLPLLVHPLATDENNITIDTHLKKLLKKRESHFIYNFETLKMVTLQGFAIGVLPTQVAKPLVREGRLNAVSIPKIPHLFGRHKIGLLVSKTFSNRHHDFIEDIRRLGARWSRS